MPSYDVRKAHNEETRAYAEHHTEPWTFEEQEVLMLWSGKESELDDVAELLGRTREACRQRYYTLKRNPNYGTEMKEHVVAASRPAWMDDPDEGGSEWYV